LRFESPYFVDEAARFVPSAPDEASGFVYEITYFAETGMLPALTRQLTISPTAR
jgi:hypothetical protein